MGKNTRLLIPIKNLEESKTSFSEEFSTEQRKNLTLSMLEDLLNVGKKVKAVDTTVVTPDSGVEDFVENQDINVIMEPDVGLNRALDIAIGDSIDSGFDSVLILPGDVPLIKPEDVEEILNLANGKRSVVITPSKENGTNALFLHPPDVMELKFGGESFPEHVKEAQSRDIKPKIYRSENLERDIDDPTNLIKVETLGKGTRTHEFLNSLK